MKKRNLLVAAVAAMMLFNVGNVNAAVAPTTANCKDGKVYTNYYYFSDMNVVDVTSGRVTITSDYSTQGFYSAELISASGVTSDDLINAMDGNDNTILFKKAQIKIVDDSTTPSGIGEMKLSDFWGTVLNKADQKDNNGTVYHLVNHTWRKTDNKEIVDLVSVPISSIDNVSVNGLKAASVKINEEPVVGFIGKSGGSYGFNVVRKYSKGITSYVDPMTTVDYQSKKWILQPLAYYIQYCKAGDGIKNDITPTKKDNLPSNPKTGVATDVAAFTLVAAAAVAGLVVARKKGLFRQL